MVRKSLCLAATTLFVVLVAAACAPAAPAAQQPAAAPANAQPSTSLAPVCPSAASGQAPTAAQHELDCVKKVPYTNISVPPGTSFEVADKSGNFTCVDSGQVANGQDVIVCHGPELQSFDLKLTAASGGGTNLAAGTGQCQQGYGYDAAQQCCSPLAGAAGASTMVTVNLGACPLPRP
jgi:hypothetical protein